MKFLVRFALAVVLVFLAGASLAQAETKRRITEFADFPSVASGKIQEIPSKLLLVTLPPSYYANPTKRYPVVYFLHGYSEGPGALYQPYRHGGRLDKAMAQAKTEFIVVEPEGTNSLMGSFYVNSPATGDWEDYIVKDLVAYIDAHYRTLAQARFRGLAGFSMGGFGCLNLALKHPEVFSCVLALSPGLLKEGSLVKAMPTWDRAFLNAYGAAFSPDLSLPAPYAQVPHFDGSEKDQAVIKNWESGFGDLQQKIDAYKNRGTTLKAIGIRYGTQDGYAWIPEGCKAFSELLTAQNIPHTLVSGAYGHTLPADSIPAHFMPFFEEAFTE